MPVSSDFREFVLEQLRRVAPVTSRRMFGAIGIYANDTFFAIIDDDIVYFKADEETRGDFIAAGSKAFAPYGDDRHSMTYFELPADVLEDDEALESWMRKSIDAAKRKKKNTTKKRKS